MAVTDAVQVTTAPAAGQAVEHEGNTFTTIREGKAFILVPPNARTSVDPQAKSKADDGSQAQNVFYNPIQQFNRDLSVLAIKAFGEDVCRKKTLKHEQQLEKGSRKRKRKQQETANGMHDGEDKAEVAPERDMPPLNLRDGDQPSLKRSKFDECEGQDEGGVPLPPEHADSAAPNEEADSELKGSRGRDAAQLSNGVHDGLAHTTSPEPSIVSAKDDTVLATDPSADQTQQHWQPRFRILDALSATGLRALRYASEIPSATSVVANDRDRGAVKSIDRNVKHNKLSQAITTTTGDALGHMYGVAFPPVESHGPHHMSGKYDVIDLDPYGSVAPFIDAGLQALEDGGLLCVTSTDSGVFASCGYSEKTFALYGGMPIKGLHSHEGGLRLMLHAVATSAARYGLAIEPLLSLSIDFYVRLFIRVRKSPADVKFLASKTMLVYSCDAGCGAWTTQFIGRHMRHKESEVNFKYSIAQAPSTGTNCEHCGSKTHVAGPMWGGPLHNAAFIEKILDDLKKVDQGVYETKSRIEGMLDTALEELTVNEEVLNVSLTGGSDSGSRELIPKTPPHLLDHHPFFFIPSALCKVIKAQAPPEELLKGALRHSGYRVTRSHCKPGSIKTDAPWTAIWEIMREWVRQRAPIKEGALREGQAGWKIMQSMRTTGPHTKAHGYAAEQPDEGAEATPEIIVTEKSGGTAAEKKEKATDLSKMEVVFDAKLGRNNKPGKRLVRYQQNPRENWGPMAKAKGGA